MSSMDWGRPDEANEFCSTIGDPLTMHVDLPTALRNDRCFEVYGAHKVLVRDAFEAI